MSGIAYPVQTLTRKTTEHCFAGKTRFEKKSKNLIIAIMEIEVTVTAHSNILLYFIFLYQNYEGVWFYNQDNPKVYFT